MTLVKPIYSFKSKTPLWVIAKYLNLIDGIENIQLTGVQDDAFVRFSLEEVDYSVDYQYGEIQFFCDSHNVSDDVTVQVKEIADSFKEHPIKSQIRAIFCNLIR